MKKILYVLVLLGLIGLIKLSYDSYVFSAQLSTIQDELHKSEQTVANLNDQLIAMQRQAVNTAPQNKTLQPSITPKAIEGLNPVLLLKQKNSLIQFALEQQQFVYAVEQLNQLDFDIAHYDLADTLRQTLHQAVIQDKQMIQQYVAARTAQLTQLNDILQQVDRSLFNHQQQTKLTVGVPESAHFWQKWFKVDVVDPAEPNVMHRKLILKEVQVRVLLAQQALLKGDQVAYQSMLEFIDLELQTLPDQYSQKLRQNIKKVKQKQLNPISKLSSSAILE